MLGLQNVFLVIPRALRQHATCFSAKRYRIVVRGILPFGVHCTLTVRVVMDMIGRTLTRQRYSESMEVVSRFTAAKGGVNLETVLRANHPTMFGLDFASGGRLPRGRNVPCVELILRS